MWQDGEIDVFDPNDDIHRFHDGISRELYKQYVMGQPALAVASAIVSGTLDREQVSERLMAKLEGLVKAIARS